MSEDSRNVRSLLPFMARDGMVYNPGVSLPADHPAVRAHPDKFVPADLSDQELRDRQAAMMAEVNLAAREADREQQAEQERLQAEEGERFHRQAREQWQRTQTSLRRAVTSPDPSKIPLPPEAAQPVAQSLQTIARALHREDVE